MTEIKLSNSRDILDGSPWRLRFERVYSTLRDRITTCEYLPGSRLDIDELSNEFGVSKTPIRSVLHHLEAEGLVISRHGVGTVVTEIDIENVREVMQFRMQLAVMIGNFSPSLVDDRLLSELSDLQRAAENLSAVDKREYFSLDMRLHFCKCRLIGNAPLRSIYRELYFRTTRLWYSLFAFLDSDMEARIVARDIQDTSMALNRGDIIAVGLLTRNYMADGLYRINNAIRIRDLK